MERTFRCEATILCLRNKHRPSQRLGQARDWIKSVGREKSFDIAPLRSADRRRGSICLLHYPPPILSFLPLICLLSAVSGHVRLARPVRVSTLQSIPGRHTLRVFSIWGERKMLIYWEKLLGNFMETDRSVAVFWNFDIDIFFLSFFSSVFGLCSLGFRVMFRIFLHEGTRNIMERLPSARAVFCITDRRYFRAPMIYPLGQDLSKFRFYLKQIELQISLSFAVCLTYRG